MSAQEELSQVESKTAGNPAFSQEDPANDVAIVVASTSDAHVNAAVSYVDSLATGSRATTISSLKRCLRALGQRKMAWSEAPWGHLTVEAATRIRSKLLDRYNPTTVRHTLTILRCVLRRAFALGQMTAERLARVTSWRPVTAEAIERGRGLTKDEIMQLRTWCERQPAFTGSMAWAILSIALGAGLRRDELCKLRVGDLSDDGMHLLVQGKGSKEAVQPLDAWIGGAIEAWLAQRSRFAFDHERLFVPVTPDGRARNRPMTSYDIWRFLQFIGRSAQVDHFTPHDLRRTYCTTFLELTGDLSMARVLMRHRSVNTTAKYDKRTKQAAERAAAVLGKHWGMG